jgi:hypothetical protein
MKSETPTMPSLPTTAISPTPVFHHVQQRHDGCGRKVHVRHRDAGLVQDLAERHVDRFKRWQPARPLGDGQRREKVVLPGIGRVAMAAPASSITAEG